MSDNPVNSRPSKEASQSPSEAQAGKRLDSWKEIAAHLQRDIRTAKRWEKNEGMPVHRHLHYRQASVYAFEEELDAWRENRKQTLNGGDAEERPSRRKFLLWAGPAVVAAVVVAVVGIRLWQSRAPVLPFAERDWVLISKFDNRTGESAFDGTLEYALEQELSNSHFVNVVPRQRINDALQLMEKPLNTAIDAKVGREVCLRDGGIRALITGRVEKLNKTYVLNAELVNPASGVTLASFSEEAVGRDQVAPAVRALANHVRGTLGEELASIQNTGQKLAKVTTPSLRALHLFTQADALIAQSREGNVSAEQLLKEAIAVDPQFASAYMHLAHALRNLDRPPEEYRPYARKALELSKTCSERERYFILGAYHSMMGEDEEAVVAYRTLVQLYPNDYWGNNNLVVTLVRLGRYQDAVPYRVMIAELQPHDFIRNLRAGFSLAVWARDPVAARPYLDRARGLISPSVRRRYGGWVAWLELAPFCESWRKGHVKEALAEINRVSRELDSIPDAARDQYLWDLGGGYVTLGQLETAENMFRSITNKEDREQGLAIVAWARNNRRGINEHLRHPYPSYFSVMLLARAGFPNQAREALYSSNRAGGEDPTNLNELRHAALGHIALLQGQTAKAISLLNEGFRGIHGDMIPQYFLTADTLARAYETQGRQQAALEVLEQASRERSQIVDSAAGAYWIWDESDRAQLLRKMGRQQKAEEIESEMRKLLAFADTDDFILQRLKTDKN